MRNENTTYREQKQKCLSCRVELNGYEVICPNCQYVLIEPNKNKTVAGLLAFFFGGLGLHRFYLGQWSGVFYLILSPTLIPSIIGLFEGIVFFTKSDSVWAIEHSPKMLGKARDPSYNTEISSTKTCPHCGTSVREGYTWCRNCNQSLSPQKATQDERECPFCAELIKAKAIKCKHCGSVISDKEAHT